MMLDLHLAALFAGFIFVALTNAAGNVQWIIYPSDPHNKPVNDEIHQRLQGLLSQSQRPGGYIYTSETRIFGLNWWQIGSATTDEMISIASHPGVASINIQCNPLCIYGIDCNVCPPSTALPAVEGIEHERRPLIRNAGLGYVWQAQFLSTAEDQTRSENGEYFFQKSAGEGVKVYILDSGVNGDNKEFVTEDIQNLQWIQPIPDLDGRKPRDDAQSPIRWLGLPRSYEAKTHGTKMLSLIAGYNLGVAKKVQPVIVRLPRHNLRLGGGWSKDAFLAGVGAINDDLDGCTGGLCAVALYGFSFKPSVFAPTHLPSDYPSDSEKFTPAQAEKVFAERMTALLNSIGSKGGLNVAANGDHANGYPAILAAKSREGRVDSLLNVGAVDEEGNDPREDYTVNIQDGLPAVFAPGIGTIAATGDYRLTNEDEDWVSASGTSTAAAITAGLAAYLIRLIQLNKPPADFSSYAFTPQGMIDFIKQLAYPRGRERRMVIWNGITKRQQERVLDEETCSG